jgi:hypothetical protein
MMTIEKILELPLLIHMIKNYINKININIKIIIKIT